MGVENGDNRGDQVFLPAVETPVELEWVPETSFTKPRRKIVTFEWVPNISYRQANLLSSFTRYSGSIAAGYFAANGAWLEAVVSLSLAVGAARVESRSRSKSGPS